MANQPAFSFRAIGVNRWTTGRVLAEVSSERDRQEAKRGEQHHSDGTGPDVPWFPWNHHRTASELEILFRQFCETEHSAGNGTWRHILLEECAEAMAATDPARLRQELIQVAAVAVNWIEDIDSRKTNTGEMLGHMHTLGIYDEAAEWAERKTDG